VCGGRDGDVYAAAGWAGGRAKPVPEEGRKPDGVPRDGEGGGEGWVECAAEGDVLPAVLGGLLGAGAGPGVSVGAVVGTPDRKNLWVLSRTPKMDEAELRGVLERARALGYGLDGLIFTRNE